MHGRCDRSDAVRWSKPRRRGHELPGFLNVAVRPVVLVAAGVSKIAFIGLVLSSGRQFLGHQAGVAVVSDLVQVGLFAVYLMAIRGGAGGRRHAPLVG